MAERFDESWEYYAGDPEVEELLAEESGRVRPDFDFRADNPGHTFRRRRPAADPEPRKPTATDAVAGHLARHGPATRAAVARATGLSPCTVATALARGRGVLFFAADKLRDGTPGGRPTLWTVSPRLLLPPGPRGDLARDFSAGALLAGPVAGAKPCQDTAKATGRHSRDR